MKKSTTSILLIIGILIVINLVSIQYYFRLDLTEDNQYTLSDATKNIMKSLDEPITVKAYFSENLPPDIAKTKKDFEEYLIEYARLSDNNLIYEFINPSDDEAIEKEAIESGIQPVMINVREKDQMKQQKAFLGAVLELGDQKEIIPFMKPGAAMEYALSTSIKKIAITEKTVVGLIQGHGEPSLSDIQQVASGLDVLYNFIPFNLNDSTPIPNHITTLALIRPEDTISTASLRQLDLFLEKGGNLFIALNRVNGDFKTAFGSVANTGVKDWLMSKGLEIKDDFVVDAQCGNVQVQQQQGMFRYNTNIKFPYIPIVSKFADHPITKGLEAVVFQFASSIQYNGSDSSKVFTPIAFTSEQSGSVQAPTYFNIQKQWTNNDLPLKNMALAGVITQKYTNGNQSKLVVVGDGDFPIGQPQQQIQPDNVNLIVNSIDWLSDDTGLIELRTKGIQFRPLDELEDSTKTILKYLNFLLPILLLIGYGMVRMQINRNKRVKRIEQNYE
jgi:gliding-associated putative ABC transporter substrate-binding component GldG